MLSPNSCKIKVTLSLNLHSNNNLNSQVLSCLILLLIQHFLHIKSNVHSHVFKKPYCKFETYNLELL